MANERKGPGAGGRGEMSKSQSLKAATGIMCLWLAIPASGGTIPTGAQGLRKPTKSDLERRQTGRKQPGSVIAVKDRFVITSFINRLEWHMMPVGVIFDSPSGQLRSGTTTVRAIDLIPEKVLWLEGKGGILAAGNHVLVCNRSFCGILSVSGKSIYEFPVAQKPPDSVLGAIAISADGTYAEVFLGSSIQGEDGLSVGAPREILAWRFPDRLRRYQNPFSMNAAGSQSGDAHGHLIQGFQTREKQR